MIDTDVTLLFFEYSALATNSFCLSCTKGAGSAQRRDPLRDKCTTRYAKLEGGLSLADTQTGRYGRLCSRRRLCARRGADARSLVRILLELFGQTPILPYN